MSTTLNLNQFQQVASPGDLDLNFFGGETVVSCRFSPSSAGTLSAGTGVKLVDLGTSDVDGPPIVDVRAADTDAIFGVVRRSLKQATFNPGDFVEIAIKESVMWLIASAALNRGVQVSLVQATPGSIQALGSDKLLGLLIDKAASGALVRVMFQNVGV